MEFKDLKYQRPDIQVDQFQMNELIDLLAVAVNTDKFMKTFNKLNQMRNHIETMQSLAYIRHIMMKRTIGGMKMSQFIKQFILIYIKLFWHVHFYLS